MKLLHPPIPVRQPPTETDHRHAGANVDGLRAVVPPALRQELVRADGVNELLNEALKALDLSWPPADFDLEAERARVAAL